MLRIVPVRLRPDWSIRRFDAGDLVLYPGDLVVVEVESKEALGCVCGDVRTIPGLEQARLPRVIRKASPDEISTYGQRLSLEREVYEYCYERASARELPMNLVAVEEIPEENKIMVYFTAEGRIDFRALVKDLVKRFRTRIEMRQIGVRNQAKMVGGIGVCGRVICCCSFLNNFDPVSIRMAKDQGLPLNPSKISGMCGRLMCCLGFEQGLYEEEMKNFPPIGQRVCSPKGEGKVTRFNIMNRSVTLLLDSGTEVEVKLEDIR
jgi:cell fate regulator YaaT (PSP1 superfamily)